MHLRNLARNLGEKAQAPADRIARRDLELFLQARLKERSPSTVDKERTTVIQLFRWAVAQGDLESSPAVDLPVIKGDVDLPPFRTAAEIEAMIARVGLGPEAMLKVWDCLYLNPQEIAGLLRTVRERADMDFGHLLHAIPAYTGMRRGEVLRVRWTDVEFDQGHIIARSRKQSRKRVETTRRIDLHPELEGELRAWHERRPGGQYVVCEANSPKLWVATWPTAPSGSRCGGRTGASRASGTGSRSASTPTATRSPRTWRRAGWTSGSSTSSWATRPRRCASATGTCSRRTAARRSRASPSFIPIEPSARRSMFVPGPHVSRKKFLGLTGANSPCGLMDNMSGSAIDSTGRPL